MLRLKRQWDNSHLPDVPTLRGVYKITMYPRWLWWWFLDKKWVIGSQSNINIAYGLFAWGKFTVYTCPNHQCLVLDYSVSKFPWKYIVDNVKQLSDGTLLGKFTIGGLTLAMFKMKVV